MHFRKLTPHKYQHHYDNYPKYIEKNLALDSKKKTKKQTRKTPNLDLLGCPLYTSDFSKTLVSASINGKINFSLDIHPVIIVKAQDST